MTPHGKSRRWAAGAYRLAGGGERLPSGRGACSALRLRVGNHDKRKWCSVRLTSRCSAEDTAIARHTAVHPACHFLTRICLTRARSRSRHSDIVRSALATAVNGRFALACNHSYALGPLLAARYSLQTLFYEGRERGVDTSGSQAYHQTGARATEASAGSVDEHRRT